MKKIAVFQMDMGVGGIQKSLLNLLRNLDYSEISVDLYLFSRENFWAESFPPEVNVLYLEPCGKINKYLPFDDVYGSLAGGFAFPEDVYYDLAIDFNSYQPECAAAAITVPAAKRVEWVHNNVEVKLENEWKYRVLHRFFRGKYKYFDGFVCVSEGIVEPFKRCAGQLSEDVSFTVIPNYIDVEEITARKAEPVDDVSVDPSFFNLVGLGRLCHQKGFDLTLEAMKAACEKRDDLRLYIIGDGPERSSLEKLASRLGLSDRVFFLGNRDNPFAVMNLMDAFVSASRYEGQGINIMEARAVGLPIYCTKNLEAYVEGLEGCEDLSEALSGAVREPKCPDSLRAYNRKILRSFMNLTDLSSDGETAGGDIGDDLPDGEEDGRESNMIELVCSLDDMSPESIGFAVEKLRTSGATDVSWAPVGMKKNRPGILLSCICREADRDELVRLIFKHTSTIGIRETLFRRYVLRCEDKSVVTEYGPVRFKFSSGYGVERVKPEYDDIAAIAEENGLSLNEVLQAICRMEGADSEDSEPAGEGCEASGSDCEEAADVS